ncbi:uncharacterized protein A4U43_C08F34880 [Asparagus officinalis]|nr:uncharacterized protein A4U43_C08F34880 [Asparagus officinalis]
MAVAVDQWRQPDGAPTIGCGGGGWPAAPVRWADGGGGVAAVAWWRRVCDGRWSARQANEQGGDGPAGWWPWAGDLVPIHSDAVVAAQPVAIASDGEWRVARRFGRGRRRGRGDDGGGGS